MLNVTVTDVFAINIIIIIIVNKVQSLAIWCIIDYLLNDVIEGEWLMKMDVEMAAPFDVPNDLRRNPQ